jgi:hypothetical protein
MEGLVLGFACVCSLACLLTYLALRGFFSVYDRCCAWIMNGNGMAFFDTWFLVTSKHSDCHICIRPGMRPRLLTASKGGLY